MQPMPHSTLGAERIIELLGLQPHEAEGGFFRETWRCAEQLDGPALAGRYEGPRSVGTAIYYMLTSDTVSALHRLQSDEVWHFYLGDPLEQLLLYPDGSGRLVTLGTDLPRGHQLQAVVPHGVWQGTRLLPGGRHGYALVGATLAPGFDFADFELGDRAALGAAYPDFADRIEALLPE